MNNAQFNYEGLKRKAEAHRWAMAGHVPNLTMDSVEFKQILEADLLEDIIGVGMTLLARFENIDSAKFDQIHALTRELIKESCKQADIDPEKEFGFIIGGERLDLLKGWTN